MVFINNFKYIVRYTYYKESIANKSISTAKDKSKYISPIHK